MRQPFDFRLAPGPLVIFILLGICCGDLRAQIPVIGLEDEEVYTSQVTFTVPSETGYETTAWLNGLAIPLDIPQKVARPDYHELELLRVEIASEIEEREVVQFIVRNPERGNSEWGLPSWVPLVDIPSAPAEFEGLTLDVRVPSSLPSGVDIPLIARIDDAASRRAGVNGTLAVDGFAEEEIRIVRGVGSRLLGIPPGPDADRIDWSLELHGLSLSGEIVLEPDPDWQVVSGTLDADTTWGARSRVRVSDDLTVASGVTLTVGEGSVVLLEAGVAVRVDGRIVATGSAREPVIFAPVDRAAPWGGFQFWEATSGGEFTHCIVTGSGANDDWFDEVDGSGSSHRDEEAAFFLSGGATVDLVECAIIDIAGQAGHGEDSFFNLTRCLVQRAVTVGQYNRGTVRIEDSALVEFPAHDAPFEDDDNDGLYMTGGAHFLLDTLFGWALDDGIDAGSGSGGSVEVTGCWVEACHHEGMAWSEARVATVSDTVAINNGQGLECGFDDPDVDARRCLLTANLIGARFGDNYDWDYEGFLTVTESLILHNRRDVWGRAWDDWSVHLDQMDIRDNHLSIPGDDHPENTTWSPDEHAALLTPFRPTPGATVGVGIATRSDPVEIASQPDGIPVRLSTFTDFPVTVPVTVRRGDDEVREATLVFSPGQSVQRVAPPEGFGPGEAFFLELGEPTGAVVTGASRVTVIDRTPEELIAAGATWKYRDDRQDLGTAWREPDHDDSTWPGGAAELGFGDDDESTELESGPDGDRTPTFYFRHAFTVDDPASFAGCEVRLRRDDGGIVYLNGEEVFRSNVPDGEVTYATYTGDTADDEDAFYTQAVSPLLLQEGVNVIAVEVHQADDDSSDISFALELLATPHLLIDDPAFPVLLRGDANEDGAVNIGDPVAILRHLFRGGAAPCADALDVDDSGRLDLADVVSLLEYLFLGGEPPASPFPRPGHDLTPDDLGCLRTPIR